MNFEENKYLYKYREDSLENCDFKQNNNRRNC